MLRANNIINIGKQTINKEYKIFLYQILLGIDKTAVSLNVLRNNISFISFLFILLCSC